MFYGQEWEIGAQAGGASGNEPQIGVDGSRRARLATLAVSYYNLAVELEYTRRYDACLCWWVAVHNLAKSSINSKAIVGRSPIKLYLYVMQNFVGNVRLCRVNACLHRRCPKAPLVTFLILVHNDPRG